MCFSVIRQKTGVNEKYTVRPRKMPKGENNNVVETQDQSYSLRIKYSQGFEKFRKGNEIDYSLFKP